MDEVDKLVDEVLTRVGMESNRVAWKPVVYPRENRAHEVW